MDERQEMVDTAPPVRTQVLPACVMHDMLSLVDAERVSHAWCEALVDPISAERALSEAIQWEQRDAPRQESWMAPAGEPYTYGRGRGLRTYQSASWPHAVLAIMACLNTLLGARLNCCMANRYETGREHLGWHADDSVEMDPDQPIVSVSLGAEREIWFRPIGARGSTSHRLLMPSGSATIMLPGMQQSWHHRIPKHTSACGPRTSLTFRRLVPAGDGVRVGQA